MDKFSLYDFMSFFLPGIVCSYISLQLIPACIHIFEPASDVMNGLIVSIVSIVLGLCLHRITFFALEKIMWYKKIVQQPIEAIVKSQANIKECVDVLNEKHNITKISMGRLFDEAYYYLEYHNKITTSKSFQSMYFFLRNLITLSILLIPVLICVLLISHDDLLHKRALAILIGCIGCIPLMAWTGYFFRMKMIERVFTNYFIAKNNNIKVGGSDD